MNKRVACIICILMIAVKVSAADKKLTQTIISDTSFNNSIETNVKAKVKSSPKVNSKLALASIDVQLDLSSIKSELTGNETVFVYARAWQGSRVPLAIKRFKLNDLPSLVTLDSSNAMAPGKDITSVEKLEVLVRVSQSGHASPQSGDWLATTGPISLETQKNPVLPNFIEQLP
ncbi:c-type cytochrome biogenesis protein CcmI/CycH [Psychromonas algicola]|uniref:c-type cytochrome biogenesis protein CcmI/CycH n=1 Tax=Psychromonas algicola TaxID=2555642 RepID=UPI001067980C|nr:hypothetical protein [Psychromonas sp. RZ5]TEW43031.1 hypothetical protein E2R67_16245 [Psychromonas sp. RZ5]